jgi:hypothetical protein
VFKFYLVIIYIYIFLNKMNDQTIILKINGDNKKIKKNRGSIYFKILVPTTNKTSIILITETTENCNILL